jgi:predicted MFS family arabinose efflux permease
MTEPKERKGLMAKMGLPKELTPGLWAIVLFGAGSSLMASWISQFFVSQGLNMNQVGLIMAIVGVLGAIAGWYGGAAADRVGPRQVMMIGAGLWLVAMIAFLTIGVNLGFWGILCTFGLTGLSSLFPFAFMGWVSYSVPQEKLGIAMGLFWTSMGLGMPLGSFYSAAMRPVIGDKMVLATGIPLVLIGALVAVFMVKSTRKAGSSEGISAALTLAVRKPAIGVVGIVRIINTLGMMGLIIYLPVWLVKDIGFSESSAPALLGALTLVNIVGNLIFGSLGDKMGWKRTVTWWGCLGCFIALMLVYYVPVWFGANILLELLAAMLFGLTLAAFVPLSALAPALAPESSGSAVAILSLAQGISQFLGSGMGGWLYAAGGAALATWTLGGCYLVGLVLMALVPDPQAKMKAAKDAA